MARSFAKVGDILSRFDSLSKENLPNYFTEEKYFSREFQKYGYTLAEELGDMGHKTLYIKMAKDLPRFLLEQARSYVKDANRAKSKPRLFMWKVHQLKKELQEKQTATSTQK